MKPTDADGRHDRRESRETATALLYRFYAIRMNSAKQLASSSEPKG